VDVKREYRQGEADHQEGDQDGGLQRQEREDD
jgi:hypothetical protein